MNKMEPLSDWHLLKAAVEEKKKTEEGLEERGGIEGLTLSNTDILIIKALLVKGRRSLKELRGDVRRSRVSVYLSIRKLKEFSLVKVEDGFVRLRDNDFTGYLHHLIHEDFDFETLIGERLLVLQSLLDWKSIDQIAVECHTSQPSVYKYLKELKPLVDQNNRRYRLKEGEWSLIGFLKVMRDLSERTLEVFQVWSSADGKLLKTKNSVNGSLTAFSRFSDFDVDYYPEFLYYYLPRKELMLEEVFVHSLRCADDEEMLFKAYEFYTKNDHRMDIFSIDELALHFDVVDSWLDLQAQVVESMEESGLGEDKRTYYYSPENTFLSKSLSSECGVILECERILKKEKLCWEILFPEYVKQQKDLDFRWPALISRLRILEKRTGVNIPILKKLSKIYLENALMTVVREPKTVSELRGEFNVSEYSLRNALNRMVGKGLIQKMDTKPIRFTR